MLKGAVSLSSIVIDLVSFTAIVQRNRKSTANDLDTFYRLYHDKRNSWATDKNEIGNGHVGSSAH